MPLQPADILTPRSSNPEYVSPFGRSKALRHLSNFGVCFEVRGGYCQCHCAYSVCVCMRDQAAEFVLNVETTASDGYAALGGHGFDGTLACGLVRCPKYDATYVANLGTR